MSKTYFSINIDFLPLNQELGFDLYVNASTKKGTTHFTRVFPSNELLDDEFKNHLKKQYPRLYVLENQRDKYMKIFVKSEDVGQEEKATFIKDTAIKYLDDIFHSEGRTEVLVESIGNVKETVDNLVNVIEETEIEGIKSLIANLSMHDFYTFDHSINVCMYAVSILKGINPDIDRASLVNIGVGALLHDIGKLKVPNSVINKPSSLSDEEFEQIKQHPVDGYNLLIETQPKLSKDVDWMTVLCIVTEHHENYDGTGYPYGKTNEQTHYFSKVCMLADIFDALTTKRSYNNVMSTEKAIKIMSGMVGKKIDPKLFQQFLAYMQVFIPQGKNLHVLDPKFDPSVPFKEIEVQEVERKSLEKPADFGKIITKQVDEEEKPKQKEDDQFGKIVKKTG